MRGAAGGKDCSAAFAAWILPAASSSAVVSASPAATFTSGAKPGIGSAAGLLLGILASRVLAALVYQATPRDPLVLAGAVLAMALVGTVAAWIPAQRALSIDPAILLREE